MTNQTETQTALAELANRYTTLAPDYRSFVRRADHETIRRIIDLARADASGTEIETALGMPRD